MPQIFPGRFAAKVEGPFVVFLIGMRINRFFAFRQWMQVAAAMPPKRSRVGCTHASRAQQT